MQKLCDEQLCHLYLYQKRAFMSNTSATSSNRAIAIWLYIGVFMIVMQILIGGITRLTESGLSITEWKPLTGTLPPMNQAEWQTEFDKYKNTAQFQYIHGDFTLSDFKTIFFWEWFHRNWARLMGLVFIVGFIYFLVKKKFKREMVMPLVLLFVLGGIQGAIGWIMVKSGLVPEKYFVGHLELATHFMAAMVLLVYLFWFALSLSVPREEIIVNTWLKNETILICVLLFVQLTYGAFMAGLHAAMAAPTWPTINGEWIPAHMYSMEPAWSNWINNKIAVQFVHRGIAYLILVAALFWWMTSLKAREGKLFMKYRHLPMVLVIVQITLGIFTVVLSPKGDNLLYFGVLHQMAGILLLLAFVLQVYLVRKKPVRYSVFGN